MATVFITGSTDGLGRAAAQSLLDDGHQVVLHARSADRAKTIGEVASRSDGIVIGDLRSASEIRSIADQVNSIGRMDAVIHNAGVYTERSARSAAAKSSPPPANAKDAPAPATENISPTPDIGKRSPSQTPAAGYDGFTVGIDDDEETGRPPPIRPRPAKQSKVRQKPETTERPSAIESLDDAEVDKLKPKLAICRGC